MTDRNGVTREEFESAAKAHLDRWLEEHPDRVDRPKLDEDGAWIDEEYGGLWRWDFTASFGWNGEGFEHGAIVGTRKDSLALGMALCDDGGYISSFGYFE